MQQLLRQGADRVARISVVAQLMRTAWRTVGQICERVAAELQRDVDLLAGLKRIGVLRS